MKKLRLLDTFSGIGGFSYAAEKLVGGFETTQFIEIEPYCQKVLKKHWPNVPIHNDITTFTAEPYSADVICGGFPCQSISQVGEREGITQESRSGKFYDLMRVIRMVRPKYVILENVAAILANGLDIVLGELSEAGYDAEWSIISASSLGAAHRRSRWWLIAYPCRNGLQREVRAKVSGETWHQKNWYETEPTIHRTVDGISNRVDRLKALGNAVVPQVAAIPLQRVKDIHEQLTSVDR
jgi:DNA (cytosine-5)-methyltransferase 1